MESSLNSNSQKMENWDLPPRPTGESLGSDMHFSQQKAVCYCKREENLGVPACSALPFAKLSSISYHPQAAYKLGS